MGKESYNAGEKDHWQHIASETADAEIALSALPGGKLVLRRRLEGAGKRHFIGKLNEMVENTN